MQEARAEKLNNCFRKIESCAMMVPEDKRHRQHGRNGEKRSSAPRHIARQRSEFKPRNPSIFFYLESAQGIEKA
jgi:hypothetical protein